LFELFLIVDILKTLVEYPYMTLHESSERFERIKLNIGVFNR